MKLSDYLAREGLTHREFAERLEVSQVTVTRYASGKRVPRSEHLGKIHALTNGDVTPNDFFDLGVPTIAVITFCEAAA